MARKVSITLELPKELRWFRFPKGVNRRLQDLLDKNNNGKLTAKERAEAEGLVNLAEVMTILRLRVEHAWEQAK